MASVRRRILWMSAAVLAAGTVHLSAECVVLTRPPLVVSGAACGTLIDQSGEAVDGADVLLTTLDGDVVAAAVADGEGRFQFAPVLAGDYRIEVYGFVPQVRTIRVSKSRGTVCTQRVEVRLSIFECPSEMVSGAGLRLRVDADAPVQLVLNGDEYDGDYTGAFDFLELDPGDYHAELRADGYVTRTFKFSIREFQIRTYRFTLRRAR